MDEKLMCIVVGLFFFVYIQLYIFKDMVVNNEKWRRCI